MFHWCLGIKRIKMALLYYVPFSAFWAQKKLLYQCYSLSKKIKFFYSRTSKFCLTKDVLINEKCSLNGALILGCEIVYSDNGILSECFIQSPVAWGSWIKRKNCSCNILLQSHEMQDWQQLVLCPFFIAFDKSRCLGVSALPSISLLS